MKNQYETSAKQVRNEYKTKDEQNQKQTSMKAKNNSQSKLYTKNINAKVINQVKTNSKETFAEM